MALVRAAQGTSSDSNTHWGYRYDVFLSFRGEDTRRTFTDHLYTALNNAGFLTFRDDDELERGEDIKPGLQKAIRQSRASVVVFSKDYASSRWCLDELVMILERKRTTSDHVVLPVFYDVDPSHARKQTGSIGKAFARHEKNQSPNKVRGWREALAELADLAGMVLSNQADGYESKFITKIVKVIGDKLLRTPLAVESNLIGIQSRVKHINLWLQDGSTDVGIVVVHGMSGIGKTTIAKYVYNSNFTSFEGSSFVENIRETASQPNGLVQIQMQLLYDILKGKEEKVHNVSEGIIKIVRAISSRRVLLVLDDVDHKEQLDAVLLMKDRFYPGSKIIITTRRERLLKAHQVTKVHGVETLDYDESLELLSWHAFGQDHPPEGYMEYSKKLVRYTGGLPLALQVLGSSLLGESMGVWESALEKLQVIPNGEIMNKLRISYDSLQDDHDRKLFLHIACFLIGRDKKYIVRILDGCDFYTTVGIQNLIDRCLVKIDKHDKVTMHDLIRDMGREIVRLESEEPEKRSRLWRRKDSFRVLREKTGTQTIQGLVLDMHWHPANSPINTNETVFETNAFERMHKLQLLHLRRVRLEGCYANFPTGLRWLCWPEFPLDSIPIDFPLECLIVLEMQYSSLTQVYKGTKFLPSLKILDVSHSHGLSQTMDFSYCPNLEELILVDCKSLLDVHESIGNLEGLVYLNMEDCKNLRMLPNMCMLKSLETLNLSGCSNLDEMMKKMESVKVLETDGILSELRPGTSSSILTYLPCSLVRLNLSRCNLSDDAFDTDLSNLSSLQDLYLDDNPISSLPVFIKGLRELCDLSFLRCKRLESLVGLPKIGWLNVRGCISLKTVTYQANELRALTYVGENHNGENRNVIEWEYYHKLEPIGKVDVEIMKLFSLHNLEMRKCFGLQKFKHVDWIWSPVQGLHQQGIYSTYFAGNEVPGRFNYKSTKSSISFIVPFLASHKIRGLNIFATYASEESWIWAYGPDPSMSIEVSNKSKGLKWLYGPRFCRGPGGRGEDVTWLSHWKMDNQTIILECGDEVVVSVMTMVRDQLIRVKEFGVELVQEHQDKMSTQHNTTPDPNDPFVIGGDLSPLENVSGEYEFCWFSEAEMKNTDFCRPKWLNTLIMDSDKEEEQQSDLDHKIAAASARGNNCHPGGWRGLVTAAVFLLTLTQIVRPSISQKKKRQ
ncbi:disease resistance protein RUN1 [Pyrus x bretschneideri]|uniref:disease resistance protein RUN1 n=1 Tax=Pyrus x bretschneideri TaxID=225117 RepID=UPI00202F6434|nr:disease resistance protein RUN1 [Pyrus x bretschneideri]